MTTAIESELRLLLTPAEAAKALGISVTTTEQARDPGGRLARVDEQAPERVAELVRRDLREAVDLETRVLHDGCQPPPGGVVIDWAARLRHDHEVLILGATAPRLPMAQDREQPVADEEAAEKLALGERLGKLADQLDGEAA